MTDDTSDKRLCLFYLTAVCNEPVLFFSTLFQNNRYSFTIAMKAVEIIILSKSLHLRGDIYEMRAISSTLFLLIFSLRDRPLSQVLLALEAFSKKTQKTSSQQIYLAEKLLVDWRLR